MTNVEPDPVPAAYSIPQPGLVELTPTGQSPLAAAEDREQRRWNRTRTVGLTCTAINITGGLCAAVLAAHIVMVLGEANPNNGAASFVRGFAAAVSLGLTDLFTPTSPKIAVLLNNGLAALIWLALAAAITMLVRRFALPGPRRPLRLLRVAMPRRFDDPR